MWQTLQPPAGCFPSEGEELCQAWRWCTIATYKHEIAAALDKWQQHMLYFNIKLHYWKSTVISKPIAKSTWQLEQWSGGDPEEAFAWKQTQTDLHSVRGGREVFFRSGKIENNKILKANIYSLPVYEQ